MNVFPVREEIIGLIDNRTVTHEELCHIEDLLLGIEDQIEEEIEKAKESIYDDYKEQLDEKDCIIHAKNLQIAVLLDIISEIRDGKI